MNKLNWENQMNLKAMQYLYKIPLLGSLMLKSANGIVQSITKTIDEMMQSKLRIGL